MQIVAVLACAWLPLLASQEPERAGGSAGSEPAELDVFQEVEPPAARLVELPEIELDSRRHAASDAEREEIAALVAKLVEIAQPDFGLSATLCGSQFAPLPGTQRFSMGLIGIDHGTGTFPALRRLVELGPKALPALLRVLDDGTPSKLEIVHEGAMGAMWRARELPTNPVNPFELAAGEACPWLRQASPLGLVDHERLVDEHVVTRGDVAFVILGQIVGREYQAVRYQPSGCAVISSPTHDPELARALRAIWTADDPSRRLFESLLHDFCTRGGLDSSQYRAALRLSYYFPVESRDLLVTRVDALDLDPAPWLSPGFEQAWRARDERNGGDAAQLIDALADSLDPAVLDALGRAVERTTSTSIVRAALRPSFARAKSTLLAGRIEAFLAVPPQFELGPYGDEYEMLLAAARYFPERAPAMFRRWLSHGTPNCRRTVLLALARVPPGCGWAVELVEPLLDDRSDTDQSFGSGGRRTPIRVCDEAALALAAQVEGASFVLEGDRADLDRQIEALRRRIHGR